MKIALFSNVPPGGSKRAFIELVKRLQNRGHEMDLFTFMNESEGDWSLKAYVKNIYSFPISSQKMAPIQPYILELFLETRNRFALFSKIDKTSKRMSKIINSKSYEVVLVNNCRYTQTPPLLKYLKNSVYICHEPFRLAYEGRLSNGPPSKSSSLFKRLYMNVCTSIMAHTDQKFGMADRMNARHATYILSNSLYSKEYLERVYEQNTVVNYLGIDTQFFRPLDVPKKNFILSVGVYHRHKGFDLIIKALSHIATAVRPKLIIAGPQGSPEYKNEIQNLANRLGVEIELKESVKNEELVRLYNEAIFTVFTPHKEPFGFVPLESMACGTPVIGVSEGGLKETIIHAKTGLLVARKEEELANAMDLLLKDENLRALLSENGIQDVAQKWTWEASCDRLEKILDMASL